MIAKLLGSPYAGCVPGQIGKVIEDLGSGFCIQVPCSYIKLFGGATSTQYRQMFFTKVEVEIREEDIATPEEWCGYIGVKLKPGVVFDNIDPNKMITEQEFAELKRTCLKPLIKDEPKTS